MISPEEIEGKKLIIFDCDGVLVDSEKILAKTYSEISNGKITFEKALIEFKGRKVIDCLRFIFKNESNAFLDKKYIEFRRKTRENYKKNTPSIFGIEKILENLKTSFCVASSSPKKDILLLLKYSNLLKFFEKKHIFSSYDIGSWKPSPEIFLTAAQYFNIAPNDCLVIEDSQVGVDAAKSAKMSVLQYYPSSEKNLKSYQFKSMNDLNILL